MRRVVRNVLPRAGTTASRRSRGRVRPVEGFRLFAVLGTWMEADVVEACVRNAFAQGVEEVFLVDNDSPDATVAVAERAGASLAVSFSTRFYNEQMRIDIMNGVMREASFASGAEHVWWLWLDADEFPHGPGGMTVREFLGGLDRRFRVVGARYFDHYPSTSPAYVPGTHPLDTMPLCEERDRPGTCEAHERHFKHPLVRVDARGPALEVATGFHRATAPVPLYEPAQHVFVHHFPYRDEEVTRARLARLCDPSEDGSRRIAFQDDGVEVSSWRGGTSASLRYLALDRVYRDAADPDESLPPGRRPWSEQVDARDVPYAP